MHPAEVLVVARRLPHLRRSAEALRARSHRDVAALLAACRRALASSAEPWVLASVQGKGWQQHAHSTAEEWASGPLSVARFLHLLHGLHDGLADGRLPAPRAEPAAADGISSFAGLPGPGLCDPLLLARCRARVDVAPGARPTAPARSGDVALVLGAGNVGATPVLDVLHQVFLEGRSVVLKLSPLHAGIEPHVRAALQPLTDAGLLQVCRGDGTLGQELLHLPGFAAVHVTGSTSTWGRLREDPATAGRQLTAEVGCCTPAFVVPGPWRDRELRQVAAQLAAFVACNGGATCLAPRALLTARGWPQREVFLQHLRAQLAALPPRVPFHGAARPHFAAAAGFEPPTAALPPTLRADLDAGRDHGLCASEHFAPVLLEVPLPGDTTPAWLDRATAFARDHVFGSLSAYVLAPARTLHAHRAALRGAILGLPHGTIAINCWTGLGFALGTAPWGVPKGRPWQHGAGWTRGTLCLPDVQRVVVQAPLRPRPLPPWLPRHRDGAATLRALTRHYLAPSLLHLAATTTHALRSP